MKAHDILVLPAVPLACHSQRSLPVSSGHPRTTSERRDLRCFPAFAGDNPARSGFASRWSIGPGLHRPCRPRAMVVPDGCVRARQADRGPDRCWRQRRYPGREVRASVSGRQRRLERRLPRRPWRSRWARRFPMAEPACLAISSRKARSGSQDLQEASREQHHKDRVHTLAPRPTRDIGFNGGTEATERAPRMRETPRVGGPVWAHSDDYMPRFEVRSSGRSSWLVSGGRPASSRCGIRSMRPRPEGRRRARPAGWSNCTDQAASTLQLDSSPPLPQRHQTPRSRHDHHTGRAGTGCSWLAHGTFRHW